MNIVTVLLLAVGLSMDAFAVSVCKGLAMEKAGVGKCVTVGLWFGGFQALMPFIGYFVGSRFADKIENFDHWIAFALLALIGLNMLREALFSKEEEKQDASLGFVTMLTLAVATSIDALASGIAIACEGEINIYFAITAIGCVTFIFSFVGVKIGNIFGEKYKKGAEITGGIILVLLGIKILLEHIL